MPEQKDYVRPKQLITPRPIERPVDPIKPITASSTSIAQSELYLLAHGWIKIGVDDRGLSMWEDPHANSKPKKHRFQLKSRDGGFDTVEQLVTPTVVWPLKTEDAMIRQRERLLGGETPEATFQRKSKELEEMEEAMVKYKQSKAAEEALAKENAMTAKAS